MAEVKLDGLDDVIRALLALPDAIVNNGAAYAMRQGANVIAKEAKLRAPVRTGNLKKRIVVRKRKRKPRDVALAYSVGVLGGAASKYGDTRANRKKGRVGHKIVEDTAYYWRFLEFGTEKLRAKPFLRPAFDAKGQEAIAAITNGLRTGLARAIDKAIKK